MNLASKIVRLAPLLLLTGCAANSYCEGEQKYHQAQTLPPLQAVEGVKLPESPSALKIPPAPANPVPYGERYQDEDGDDAMRCLDKPPALPELSQKPAEPAAGEKPPAETPPAETPPAETPPAETPATPD